MISGAVEMILRIVVIVCFLDIIGFVATAYVEAAAWTGALLLNAVAFVILYNKEVKKQKSKEVNI